MSIPPPDPLPLIRAVKQGFDAFAGVPPELIGAEEEAELTNINTEFYNAIRRCLIVAWNKKQDWLKRCHDRDPFGGL